MAFLPKSWWRVIRWRPFDTATPEGRAQERVRRMALTTLASAAARAITIGTGLIVVPLTLNYLGAERYGLWMTVTSIVGLLAFADFGIGNGLLNALAAAYGRDDREAARESVAGAFFMLALVALALGLVFSLAYPLVSWPAVFNVISPQARTEAGPAVAVFIACFLLNIPLGVILRTQMGYQEGFLAFLWQGAGSLASLAALLLAICWQGTLPWLVAALSGVPVVVTLLNGVALFGFQRPWLRPAWRYVRWRAARRIIGMGVYFFLLQVLGIVNYSSDNIIISQVLGAEAVAGYAVAMRLFSLLPVVLSMFIVPLWSAYGEAYARGDAAWIKRTFRTTLGWSFLISLAGGLVMVPWGQSIIHWWVGPQINLPFNLLLGMGVANLFNAFSGAVAMLFNGLNILRFQVIVMSVTAVLLLAAKIGATRWMGLAGMVWGTVAVQLVCSHGPSLVYLWRRVWPRLNTMEAVA